MHSRAESAYLKWSEGKRKNIGASEVTCHEFKGRETQRREGTKRIYSPSLTTRFPLFGRLVVKLSIICYQQFCKKAGCIQSCVKNIPAKFQESPSKCSVAHPKNTLWHNISASPSRNLAGMFLHDFEHYKQPLGIVFSLRDEIQSPVYQAKDIRKH